MININRCFKCKKIISKNAKRCRRCNLKNLNKSGIIKHDILNLINKRFGKLKVIKITNKRCRRSVIWKCKCSCGKIKYVSSYQLTNGLTKSCGCLRHKNDLIHKRSGKLLILKRTNKRTKCGLIIWKCKCDCGKITYQASADLKLKRVLSCGCNHHLRGKEHPNYKYRKSCKIRTHTKETLRKHKMTLKMYKQIAKKQNYKCAICRNIPKRTFHIDHDHKTGKVRGLLCVGCNTLLGKIEKYYNKIHLFFNYLKERNK